MQSSALFTQKNNIVAEKQILIIGKSGQVGYQLRRTIAPLGQITALEYPELDLCNPQSIRSTLSQLKPAVILNAAAILP